MFLFFADTIQFQSPLEELKHIQDIMGIVCQLEDLFLPEQDGKMKVSVNSSYKCIGVYFIHLFQI